MVLKEPDHLTQSLASPLGPLGRSDRSWPHALHTACVPKLAVDGRSSVLLDLYFPEKMGSLPFEDRGNYPPALQAVTPLQSTEKVEARGVEPLVFKNCNAYSQGVTNLHFSATRLSHACFFILA